MRRVTALLLVALFAVPPAGLALTAQSAGAAATQDATPAVDPTKLGVSLDRIRRELRQAEVKEQSGGGPLRLEFRVEVYGQAPKIDLLKGFPVSSAAVQYGSPTHQEVLDVLTPKEFRSPAIPFSALAVWAAQKLWEKSKKQRCEEEIAEYRQLVMAGVAVAAPRCTQ